MGDPVLVNTQLWSQPWYWRTGEHACAPGSAICTLSVRKLGGKKAAKVHQLQIIYVQPESQAAWSQESCQDLLCELCLGVLKRLATGRCKQQERKMLEVCVCARACLRTAHVYTHEL
eukprot:1161481-Pelagomonas_calceolata.AAC.11